MRQIIFQKNQIAIVMYTTQIIVVIELGVYILLSNLSSGFP